MELRSTWQWQLLVKLLKNFNLVNFKESYLRLGTPTTNVELLMKIKNNLEPIDELKNCNIALFKSDIQPLWEDPQNKKGCALIFRRDTFTKNFFDWFICFVLSHESQVNGCYIKVQPTAAAFQIWLPSPANVNCIEKELKEIIGDEIKVEVMYFKSQRQNSYSGTRESRMFESIHRAQDQ